MPPTQYHHVVIFLVAAICKCCQRFVTEVTHIYKDHVNILLNNKGQSALFCLRKIAKQKISLPAKEKYFHVDLEGQNL